MTKPAAPKTPKKAAGARYHHGDLAPVLRQSALGLIEEQGLAALTLRSLAKRAGVSHAAPYRHYQSREALLAYLAEDGFNALRGELLAAAGAPGPLSERIVHVGAAYARFAAMHGDLLRLMFGHELKGRENFPKLAAAADALGAEIGEAFGDQALGLAVWAAAHGIAMLLLENIIDVGQRQSGMAVISTRAEMLLRSLFAFTDR